MGKDYSGVYVDWVMDVYCKPEAVHWRGNRSSYCGGHLGHTKCREWGWESTMGL